MYCPNCSAGASTDQRFCRSCGMDLQAVAELISAQSGLAKAGAPKKGGFDARQRASLLWGLFTAFGAVAAASVLRILNREHIQPVGEFTPYLSGILVVIAFIGLGLACYPFLQTLWSHSEPNHRGSSRTDELTGRMQQLLPEEPLSVTEHTTELMEASRPRTDVRDTTPQSE